MSRLGLVLAIGCVLLGAPTIWAIEDAALNEELRTRVARMEATIKESLSEGVDVTAIPGRAEYIRWAVSVLNTDNGYRDSAYLAIQRGEKRAEDFLRLDYKGFVPLIVTLGDLKAAEAAPALSQYLVIGVFWGGFASGYVRKPLMAIGEPALPSLFDRIRESEEYYVAREAVVIAGTILGEKGLERLDREIESTSDAEEKARLEGWRSWFASAAQRARNLREVREEQMKREAEEELIE